MIGKKKGLYIEQMKRLEYKGDRLNQHIIQRDLKVLKYLGLIEVQNQVGRTTIYGTTELAKDTILKYKRSGNSGV